MVTERVAVLGGDGRDTRALPSDWRIFPARRYGGEGPTRRLLDSIASGGVDLVIIVARWNSHASTKAVMRACRRAHVRLRVVSRLGDLGKQAQP